MNTPNQREEEEQTWRTHGSLNVVFGFCDINGGDMCKSELGERKKSQVICIREDMQTL